MDKINKTALIVIADIIVFAVTLTIFFVGFGYVKKATFDYVALVFVLISEIILFVGLPLLTKFQSNKVFIRAGISSTLVLYWMLTTLVSIIYKPMAGSNINGLVTVQVIVLALAMLAVIGILFFYISFGKNKEDIK